jgi:SAM-dependent methyltransferase
MDLRQLIPRQAVPFFRALRNSGLWMLEPVDFAARALNGKRGYPPLRLRRYVGPLPSFESAAAEFVAYLKTLAHLQPTERLLDVGCGCGTLGLFLRDYFVSPGGYEGIDLHRPSIDWAQRALGSEAMRFRHLDIQNDAYNPHGKLSGSQLRFDYPDESFNAIILKSVFTHLRPPDLENYLGEIRRLLRPGGRCMMTFFLLRDRHAQHGRKPVMTFPYGEGTWRYAVKGSPEAAIAYDETYVLQLLERKSLKVLGQYPGTWTGLPNGLSFQDIVLAGHV